MLSILLFTSGGELFLILLVVLIFFGADKIPEFTRMMGKGVREFRKATDDIKREFQESSSGMVDEIMSVRDEMADRLTKEIAEPVQETVKETTKTFEEYHDQYNDDYHYDNRENTGSYGNEYQDELQANTEEPEKLSSDDEHSEGTSPATLNDPDVEIKSSET